MKMKGNNLSSGSYTAIFEIFVISPSGGFRVDDTIIYQVYGDSHYTIDTFNSNKINIQYTKSFIQFTTDGGAGVDDGIKFQIKYFGSQYNKNIRFLFYSRVIKGKQSTSFDHTIFNVRDVQDNHTILYFENLNLNGNLIDGLGNPERLAHATNKNYVDTENARQDIAIADKASKSYADDEIAKIPNNYYKNNEDILVAKKKKVTFQIDPTNSFPVTPSYVMNMNRYGIEKCGPITMADSGNSDIDMNNSEIKKIGGIEMNYDNDSEIDMKNNKITDVGGIVMYNDDDSKINMNGNKIINLDAPSGDNHAANKKSVDDKISEIPVGDSSGLLPLDGSKAMTGDLNMGTKSIINLADPTANSHGANKKSVDGKIEASEEASIRAVQQENVFARVVKNDDFKEDDDDIHKVGSVQKDFHQVNHQTYQFKSDYDSSIGYHSTRLSIDLIYLPLGSYTLVYEMYIEDGITIDEINAVSGTLNVVNINSKIYGTNTRSIIHFTKSFFSSVFDDLEIDIKLKSKTDPQTTIYVVVYGVSGYQNNVDPLVWDRFYYIENKIVHFEAPIDMNGNKITGVAAGVDDSDVINKSTI